MKRPDFKDIKTFEEFSKYYWYREELIKICSGLGLKSNSGKIELYKVIEAYFNASCHPDTKTRHPELVSGSVSKEIPNHRERRLKAGKMLHWSILSESPSSCAAKGSGYLSLSTTLIECNFTFGPRFREFFENQTGIKPFKFNVDMVATVEKVKETGDTNFTLGDLLEVYYGKKTYAKYDKSALQWNKFVKDFCADPATTKFPNKLKVAAALWKEVRESTREKVYTSELLEILPSLRAQRSNPQK